MAALVAAIHEHRMGKRLWIAATSAAMTDLEMN